MSATSGGSSPLGEQITSDTLMDACTNLAADASNLMEMIEEQQRRNKQEQEYQESLNRALTTENVKMNTEIQEAKKLLVSKLPDYLTGNDDCGIAIKRLGEIDIAPFFSFCKRRRTTLLSNEATITRAHELCSEWENKLDDAAWRPFKKVNVEGIEKEVVDESDGVLKKLKKEMGIEVFKAVKTALEEINEHNPSGGYAVSKFWNIKANREATLKEIIEIMFNIMNPAPKNKRGLGSTKGG